MGMRSAIGVALLVGLGLSAPAEAAGGYSAEIRRTAYGAPHIKAADFGGLGYGAGYAAAEDNFCDFAERTLTVNGQRSRYFGPGDHNSNILSDIYHRGLIESGG